jgi:hypothetical protein
MTAESRLTIQNRKLVYTTGSSTGWTLDIDRIKFVGEYTTANGPWTDDWFFVFAEVEDQWWQVPAEAVDHSIFWALLGQALDCDLAPGLFGSTTWATHVLYPKALEGQDLFVLVNKESRSNTLWQRLFGSSSNQRVELAAGVKQLFVIP